MEIKYKGVTRLPSDRDSFNGELEESINITNVAGELRPYITPSVIGQIAGSLLFVHKNNGYEHFISLDGTTLKAYDYKNGEIISLGNITNVYGETVRRVESVGNTLVVLTDQEIKYALFKESSYKYLGNKIPFPIIQFSLEKQTHDSTETKPTFQQLFNYVRGEASLPGEGKTTEFNEYITTVANTRIASYHNNNRFVFPFFVRYAIELYDGSLTMHSMPFLMLPSYQDPFFVGINSTKDNNDVLLRFYSALLKYNIASSIPEGWSDIVNAVNIYISAPAYTYKTENQGFSVTTMSSYPFPVTFLQFSIHHSPSESVIDKIMESSVFYKVHSLSITETVPGEIKADMNTLVNQERMVDDYLSHDTITAENSFTYNHKLHLSGISRSMFPGFKLAGQRCYYEGAKSEASIEIGNQPFIFYPGKSSHLTIAQNTGSGWKEKSLALSSHPYLNGSYYINPSLGDIQNDGPLGSTSIDVKILFAQQKQDESEVNKLYVSAHQNPFVFPVNSRITLPVGRIIGMASNTEAISQGQFGQFPLFVFTDDGVWALELNQEGKYLARQPVSRDVCINPNILQMDKYIGFITEKGLMILSGSQTECITDIIRENNIRTSKIPISSFLSGVGANSFATIYNTDNIEVFLKECSLAYEYLNGKGRIFIINKNFNYSYVFDIESKSWGKIESDFKNVVNNYPDCYVQNSNGEILNLSTLPISENRQKCLFVTRPISNDNLFSINKIAHRGIFKSELNTVIYASRDGEKYAPIASGTRRLLSMRGSPYKFFKIAVISDLYPTDSISGCVIDFTERYTNRIR